MPHALLQAAEANAPSCSCFPKIKRADAFTVQCSEPLFAAEESQRRKSGCCSLPAVPGSSSSTAPVLLTSGRAWRA